MRRGLGKVQRLFMGSVSGYLVEHAPCSVCIVKGEHGPSEEHPIGKEEVKKLEEKERQRRIELYKKQLEEESSVNKYLSEFDKRVSHASEEVERARRLEESEEEKKIAAKLGKLIEEESKKRKEANYPHKVEFISFD